jgi:hypothetical protein
MIFALTLSLIYDIYHYIRSMTMGSDWENDLLNTSQSQTLAGPKHLN